MMFLDTSGLLCCLDSSESRHSDAVTFFDAAGARLTHNYVLAELVALADARKLPRASALLFVRRLAANPDIELIWVDSALHESALNYLEAQTDKTYSLCDAVSFILMNERGLGEALTTDQHFDQAGFRRLLPR
jgi:predicted nucleic acid-binding protein